MCSSRLIFFQACGECDHPMSVEIIGYNFAFKWPATSHTMVLNGDFCLLWRTFCVVNVYDWDRISKALNKSKISLSDLVLKTDGDSIYRSRCFVEMRWYFFGIMDNGFFWIKKWFGYRHVWLHVLIRVRRTKKKMWDNYESRLFSFRYTDCTVE